MHTDYKQAAGPVCISVASWILVVKYASHAHLREIALIMNFVWRAHASLESRARQQCCRARYFLAGHIQAASWLQVCIS